MILSSMNLQSIFELMPFFSRSHCHQKTIALQYVPSELQLTDFFTKAQTREQHRLHLLKLNASDLPLSLSLKGGVKAFYLPMSLNKFLRDYLCF